MFNVCFVAVVVCVSVCFLFFFYLGTSSLADAIIVSCAIVHKISKRFVFAK